ncbi:transposase [Streptomyces sp. TG1A-60]|uniref:transposase n=1 Tax=Streptomyces sp. TG1A-60 TaxID=3129111 RepID=UPI0030CD0EA7
MLEPLLPKGKKPGRPATWARRQLIDGIRFRVRTGIPWRDLPAEYGPWGRAYDLFRRWQRDGTWHRIFSDLQARADEKELITWDISVDSTVCRAHQHAAGARKRGAAEGAAWRRQRRAGRPRARALARRPDHQVAPCGRTGPEAGFIHE